MSKIDDELRSVAITWRDDDPDEETRAEIDVLLSEDDAEGLGARFSGDLKFGTAGLRGILGAGPNRMNRRVVLRATAGLIQWVKEQVPDAAERGVAIGFDGRKKSRRFADDVAEVVCGAGLRAWTFDQTVPTPVLAFAALDRNAAAAVMVTASHNPPAYNGYKVYWENGAQIIPPHDGEIATRIAQVDDVAGLPRMPRDEALAAGRLTVLGEELERRYLDGVRELALNPDTPRELTIAYTALHGVGDRFARAALADAGFTRVFSVPEQAEPDGAFPTVDFPNPEEKGAMDLALALGAKEGADLILANDPDADRLAVAIRDEGGEYEMLTGNEVGCLLAHYVLSSGAGEDRMVLSSIVSSPWLGDIAAAHGVHFQHTLTGFKWIANEAIRLEKERSWRFAMGYEEAIGYTIGTLVRDKDGVSAAAVFADFAAWCKSQGRTVLDEREIAWRRYGMFLSELRAIVLPGDEGAARIRSIMENLASNPPMSIGGVAVAAFSNLETRTRTAADGTTSELDYPVNDVLLFELEGGHRIMARPSGTEPKIKFYFDARIEIGEGEDTSAAQARGDALLSKLVTALAQITGTA